METTIRDLAKAMAFHQHDPFFWWFLDDYARRTNFPVGGSPEKFGHLVMECDRQLEWLVKHNGRHVADLESRMEIDAEKAAGFVTLHIAAQLPSKIGFSDRDRELIQRNSFFGEWVAREDKIAVTRELSIKAHAEHDAVVGRIIRAARFRLEQASSGPVDTEGSIKRSKPNPNHHAGETYDLVKVVKTDPNVIGIAGIDDSGSGQRLVLSYWRVEIMTGPHRGEFAYLRAPTIKADGTRTAKDTFLASETGGPEHEALSDDDLAKLVKRDLADLAGKTILVSHATAYVGDTDSQIQLSFDPPIEAVVDQIADRDIAGSIVFNKEDGVTLVDHYVDFQTADPQADGYRSMFCHGLTYRADGRIDPTPEMRVPEPAPDSGPVPQSVAGM